MCENEVGGEVLVVAQKKIRREGAKSRVNNVYSQRVNVQKPNTNC